MDIIIVTSGKEKEQTLALLEALNFPFNKKLQKKVKIKKKVVVDEKPEEKKVN